MTIIADIEATNSPKNVGAHEDELPFEFDWTLQGTPTAVSAVKCYNRQWQEVSGAISGTPAIAGNRVNGVTLDCTKLAADAKYYLVCIATIGGRERGMFCEIRVNPVP